MMSFRLFALFYFVSRDWANCLCHRIVCCLLANCVGVVMREVIYMFCLVAII